jgi:hypothetical protein
MFFRRNLRYSCIPSGSQARSNSGCDAAPKSFTKDLSMNETATPLPGTEHWADKDGVKLFLWNKCAVEPAAAKGVVLFVHGSSMPGQPTFDFHMPGRPNSSAMEFFAGRGYDT